MKKRFLVYPILTCLFSSCNIYSYSPYQKDATIISINEALLYKLESVDTLVDIGSGDAKFDKIIFHAYPKIFIVLEDFEKIGKINQKSFLKQTFKNNKFIPNVKTRYRFVPGEEDTIPLATNSAKVILCRKTIHEFSNIPKMTSELNRVLKKDGALIISEADPVSSGATDPRCDKKYFTKKGLDSLLSIQNFERFSMDSITYDTGRMNVLKYRKK